MSDDDGRTRDVSAQTVHLCIPALPDAVRRALRQLDQATAAAGLSADARSSAEVVLAEVLNNIVEHAYSGRSGDIQITFSPGRRGGHFQVVDDGLPMPGGFLPAGLLPTLEGEVPEGGFGWHLIRSLAEDITYRREGGKNLLGFRLVW